ncbi:biotin transporter BioY [Bengtsoniella intestinalis]
MTTSKTQSVTQSHRTKELVYTAIFAVLIAVCSWIAIPSTVPFTMQTFGVFLALLLLGGRCGTQAVVVYLLLGQWACQCLQNSLAVWAFCLVAQGDISSAFWP